VRAFRPPLAERRLLHEPDATVKRRPIRWIIGTVGAAGLWNAFHPAPLPAPLLYRDGASSVL